MKHQDILVLIPAYNPCNRLVSLTEAITNIGFKVLIINDGSNDECMLNIQEAAKIQNVTVIHQAINLGKGAALKFGFNFVLVNHPNLLGVVTADADGQHLPEDIQKVANSLKAKRLTLGVRKFNRDVPFKSKFGNLLTIFLFNFFTRLKIKDTQTGLRAIPTSFMKELLPLRAMGYEFELDMLLHSLRLGIHIDQVEIQTVYIENNSASHFNPIVDSLKIYFLLFRFVLSSLLTFLIDYFVFGIIFFLTNKIFLAQVLARIPAGIMNYQMNKRYVFINKKANHTKPILFYISLVASLTFASHFLILLLTQHLGLGVYAAKMTSELLLFIVSFSVQRDFIFSNKEV